MIADPTQTGPADTFAQSFATQYLSLILLILIVSVAAFLPKGEILPSVRPVVESIVEVKEAQPIFSADIPDLITPGAVNVEALTPYRALIDNHDVSIRVTLFFQHASEIATAEKIAERVRLSLEESGFSPEALELELAHASAPRAASLKVFEGASRWNQ